MYLPVYLMITWSYLANHMCVYKTTIFIRYSLAMLWECQLIACYVCVSVYILRKGSMCIRKQYIYIFGLCTYCCTYCCDKSLDLSCVVFVRITMTYYMWRYIMTQLWYKDKKALKTIKHKVLYLWFVWLLFTYSSFTSWNTVANMWFFLQLLSERVVI